MNSESSRWFVNKSLFYISTFRSHAVFTIVVTFKLTDEASGVSGVKVSPLPLSTLFTQHNT